MTRTSQPEVYTCLRRSPPRSPAPAPIDLSRPHTRDLTAELGLGWTRAIILRPASVTLQHYHHGVRVAGPVELVPEHVPAALAAIAAARRGEATRTRLYLPGTLRHVRVTTDADGLRLRVHTQQRQQHLGPRQVPLSLSEIAELERGLVALATARAA